MAARGTLLEALLQKLPFANLQFVICRGLHGKEEYGFASAPARSWDRGARCFVRRFVSGLDEAEACFGGSMTGEACRSMVPVKCYAGHSGELADSPRQGRL